MALPQDDFEELPATAGADDFEELPSPGPQLSAPQSHLEELPAQGEVVSVVNTPNQDGRPSYLPEITAPAFPAEANESIGPGMPVRGMLERASDEIGEFARPVTEPIRGFKKHLIDPIVKWHQAGNRKLYFGEAFPDEGLGVTPDYQLDPNSPGRMLREKAPFLATLVEGVGELALGETSFNVHDEAKADALDPRARKVQEQVRQKTEGAFKTVAAPTLKYLKPETAQQATTLAGDIGAAAFQSTLHGLSEAGLVLLPGAGQKAVVQGLTGGFVSGMVTPGGDPINDAIGGAVLGGALSAGAKGVRKLWQMAKGAKTAVPAGLIPPDSLPVFAEHVASAPEPTVPSRDMSDVAVVVQDVTKAGRVNKAIRITPEGVTAQTLGPKTKVPDDVPWIETHGTDATNTLTAAEEAALREEGLALGLGKQNTLVRREGYMDQPAVGDDWDVTAGTPDIKEGLVLVIEGGDGAGTARLYDVKSPKLQVEILAHRELSEVTLPDGSKHLGFPGPGGEVLLKPDADELIPGASQVDVNLKGLDVEIKPLSRPRIKELIAKREFMLREAEDAAAVAQADVAARSRDIALGGNGDGSKLPPPPPHDAMPPPPPPNPHNVGPTEEIAVRWWDRLSRTPLAKGLLNPTARGPRDVSDLAMSSMSVDTFERNRDKTLQSLARHIPEVAKKSPADQRLVMSNITRYLLNDIKLDQLKSLHPELNNRAFLTLEAGKFETANDHQRLIDLGLVRPDQKIEDVLGVSPDDEAGYMTQIYWRHFLAPGDWRRMAHKDEARMAALTNAIKHDVYSTPQYKDRTDAQRTALAKRHLDFLLGNPEKMAEIKRNPKSAYADIIAEAAGSLKARKDLRWWEKAALGEIDNPFIRMAETRTRQKQLILQGEMWKSISENPKLSVRPDAASEAQIRDWVEVPKTPGKYGKAAGMLVSPETWEAMVQAPLAQRGMNNFLTKSANAIKYGQTVGNPGSWVSNFIGNAQGAALSNMVNPFASPYSVGKGFLEFSRDLKAHDLMPGIRGNVRRERFERMMELGIVGSDYSTGEFREAAVNWHKLLEAEANTFNGKVNAIDVWTNVLEKGTKGKEKLARWYGTIDTMWKYSAALNGLKKGGMDLNTGLITNKKKALRFIGDRYMPGMSDDNLRKAVELEVASRIHKSFPMLDRVGSAVAAGSRAVGAVNPYIKVQSELFRNYATVPKRILTEPGMAANMLGYAAMTGGAYFLLKELRKANGIDQEEVDRAFAAAPKATARFKPGAFALPFRTAQGRISIVDLTQIFHPMTFLQGNPETAAGGRILQNMLMSPINGSLLEPELQNLLAQGGYMDPAYTERTPPEWQREGALLLGKAFNDLGPGVIRNTYNTVERGGVGFEPKGVRGPTVPDQSPLVTGLSAVLGPNRIQEIGGKEAEQRAIQSAVFAVQQAQKELAAIGIMNEGQSTGPLTGGLNKAEAFRKARAVLDQKIAALEKLQQQFGRTTP